MTKRRDALRELMMPIAPIAPEDAVERKNSAKSGSLKAMGLSLRNLSQDADEAIALRKQLSSGEHIVELDPSLIDASFIRDRIEEEGDEFEELVSSIASTGQLVPILVRPHPEKMERYQVAYGHRRLAAIRKLGKEVKAIVKALSDEDLIVAQGKENSERKDLSFIEKALFAAKLEDRGFERSSITAALSLKKGNLSTMIAIVRAIPEPLILAIGSAPKIGRPRWEVLAGQISNGAKQWLEIVDTAEFKKRASDDRFAMVVDSKNLNDTRPIPMEIKSSDGTLIARLANGKRQASLVIDEKATPAFANYLAAKLPEIYASFKRKDA